jgi:CrcB protein
MMATCWWIGLGGFLGANARYLVGQWAVTHWGVTFPYGTMIVNITGSFILCSLVAFFGDRGDLAPTLRMALIVGFLGSYTTFSTFSNEWLQLLERGETFRAMIYLLGSVLGGGLAGSGGLLLGRGLASS